jgi:hypothetical protein
MRWKVKDRWEWYRWFAWYPVCCTCRTWVWWEHVERRWNGNCYQKRLIRDENETR